MELLLNLFWLLLAILSLGLWRKHWSQAPRHHDRTCLYRQSLFSLACVLLLLFPAISLTDDLHADQTLVEESSPYRKVIKGWFAGKISTQLGSYSAPYHLAAAPALVSPEAAVVRLPFTDGLPLPNAAVSRSSEGRAPPRISPLAHS